MKKLAKIILICILLLGVVYIALQKKDIPVEQLIPKYTNEYSKFVTIDGLKTHYRIEGSGSPILLIHGTGSCLQSWDGWADSLKKYYTVIRLDLPGFGLTGPRADKDYSIDMYVNFIDKFVNAINLDSTFAIAGNSLGGQIAWNYTFKFQPRITKQILVDPAGYYAGNKSKSIVFSLARIKWIADIMKTTDSKLMVNNTLKEVYFDKSKISDATKQMYYDMSLRAGNREAFVDRVQQITADQPKDIKQINTPSLILWGDHDVLIDVAMVDSFMVMPNAQKIIYKNIGHVPQEEIPTESVNDVLKFMKE